MAIDRYPEAAGLAPEEGEVVTAELVVTDDVLVKAFALGPGAVLDPHEHGDSTNVFHLLEGTLTVIQGENDDEERLTAEIVALAVQYGRYGYRRITALLRQAG